MLLRNENQMTQTNPAHLRILPVDNRPVICHVIHAMGVGGAEVLADQMIRRMSDEFRCVVAVLDDIGDIGNRLIHDGFTVEHLHRSPGVDWRCAKRLCEFADGEGAGILHAHQYTPFFQAMLSRGMLGRRPVVFTEHGRHYPDLPSWKRSMLNRLLLKKRDRLIACGGAVQQALIRNEGLPESRIEVIYNGVDLKALSRPSVDARARIRHQLGLNTEDFVAVLVARLHRLKDHATALRAVARARNEIPGLRLLLVGEGDQRESIERIISENHLESTVTLAGARTDIPDLLSASDVFLLSSLSEGIPLTVIEAMAARRPVISTAVGGLPELIEHRVTGLLAPAGDEAVLAKHLSDLHSHPDLRSNIAEAAHRNVVRKFSLDGMLNRYREVYREVLNLRCPDRERQGSLPQSSAVLRKGAHS
jgi:glycosyltransferase involved in cell wall biosynthesis